MQEVAELVRVLELVSVQGLVSVRGLVPELVVVFAVPAAFGAGLRVFPAVLVLEPYCRHRKVFVLFAGCFERVY